MTTTKLLRTMAAAALLSLGACTSNPGSTGPGDDTQVNPPTTPGGTASGDQSDTFNHDNNLDEDPWTILQRMQEEGPPAFSARLHSCPKMKFGTIGRVLASRGVDLGGTGSSAGGIYSTADQALGVANYPARIPESNELTTASASKLFDIWVAAAPEIIANMPNRAECQVGGVGVSMFNAQGQCTVDGITCLIGVPATATHVELCNQIVSSASSPQAGQVLAVASLAAAAHTCE
jgi:hypothetical protein